MKYSYGTLTGKTQQSKQGLLFSKWGPQLTMQVNGDLHGVPTFIGSPKFYETASEVIFSA